MMDWNQLLSTARIDHQRQWVSEASGDERSQWQRDHDRLIFSGAFRRLAVKTQVHPLSDNDHVHTRLSHSLEVASVGRSLGARLGQWMRHEGLLSEAHSASGLGALVQSACLAHDIGNPPFGHFGEEAIKKFFENFFENNSNTKLTELEKADFKNFDGNVQTLRILSKLYYFGDSYGYNLNYSSLASIIKYPSNSLDGNKKPTTKIAKKKFGYFVTETNTYKEINDYLKLENRRHPVVYLLEAADDIAYSAADIEDGVKLGKVNLEQIEKIFSNKLERNKKVVFDKLNELKEKYAEQKNIDESLLIEKFRIFTQQIMIDSIVKSFNENYDEIMEGKLENEIIEISDAKDIRDAYKQLGYIVFDDKSILKKEIAGWEAIYGLLEIFITASQNESFKDSGNNLEARLYKIISKSHRKIFEDVEEYPNFEYKKIQLIVDFISGMTDRYAIRLFQSLKGIKV